MENAKLRQPSPPRSGPSPRAPEFSPKRLYDLRPQVNYKVGLRDGAEALALALTTLSRGARSPRRVWAARTPRDAVRARACETTGGLHGGTAGPVGRRRWILCRGGAGSAAAAGSAGTRDQRD
eukprot:6476466-Prymnesium_polylepis.2